MKQTDMANTGKQFQKRAKLEPPANTAPSALMQRKCVCGNNAGLDGECEECRNKKLGMQRRAASSVTPGAVPPIVHEVLQSPGKPLDAHTRATMEPKFVHDFSQVRVHEDAKAAASAQAVNALAYTVGKDVVFGAGQFAPTSSEGTKLLAHELTHVVQQSSNPTSAPPALAKFSTEQNESKEREADLAATAAVSGRAINSPSNKSEFALQRDANEEEESLQLPAPQFGFRRSDLRLLPEEETRLQLDPEIEAQMRAMQFTSRALSLNEILSSLLNLDPNLFFDTQPSPLLRGPAPQPRPPLVPVGPGPAEPSPGKIGDIITALMRVPAVDTALSNLRTQAEAEVRQNWRSLSTGERVLVITGAATIAGGALAGALSDPEARSFALEHLQDRAIPVPGVSGLSFQFRATGDNPGVRFNLNVGQFLPAELGFK